MNEIGQLRIYVAEKYLPIFQEVSRNKMFAQNKDFFMYCVFVGDKNNQQVPIEKRHELCQANTLNVYDQTALKALYLKSNRELSTFKEVVDVAEQFANGGIEYLIEHVLSDVLMKDDDGTFHIKQYASDELQLKLTNYVLEEKESVPF